MLFPSQVQAQADFQPGYVLPPAGDTLRGEVDYRDAHNNAQRCRFRPGPAGAATTYLPAQLRGYGFTARKQYRTLIVPASGASQPAGEAYFMEILADGPAKLYFLRNGTGYDRFYVVSPTTPLTLLTNGTRYVEVDGTRYQQALPTFRTTLAAALAGCAAVQHKLPSLPYTETAIQKAITLYNRCQGSLPTSASAKTNSVRVRIGAVGGVSQSRLTFKDDVRFNGLSLPYYTGPTVGLAFGFEVPRLSHKLTIQTMALYEQQKCDTEYKVAYPGSISGERQVRVHLNLAYLRLPLMLRYTYPRGVVRPMVETGFVLGCALKTENSYQTTNYFGQYLDPQPLLPDGNIARLDYGVGAGAGLTTALFGGRDITLLLRAETSYGFAYAVDISSAVHRFSALLSVNLSK